MTDWKFYECAICGGRFETLHDWDNRHDLHDRGCDRDECSCDYPVHEDCCPCMTGKEFPKGLQE